MSALSDAIAGMSATLKVVAGLAVTYHRGSDSVSVTAIPGVSALEMDDGQGVIQFQSADFLIAAADLVLNGAAVKPARGDYVLKPSTGERYDVLDLPFRKSDPAGTLLRIHTRQVS